VATIHSSLYEAFVPIQAISLTTTSKKESAWTDRAEKRKRKMIINIFLYLLKRTLV